MIQTIDLTEPIRHELMLHPKAELVDIFKLTLQAIFGPGHLMADVIALAKGIEAEIQTMPVSESVDPAVPHQIKYQDIGNGNGFVRIGLLPRFNAQDNLMLAKAVVASSVYKLSFPDLIIRWVSLLEFLRTFYDATDLAVFTEFISQKSLVPSHSTVYRTLYKPHYRLIRADMLPQLQQQMQSYHFVRS